MPAIPTLIVSLLAAAVGLETIAARFRLPRPVVLLCGGLAISLIPGLPALGGDPESIFIIFIPPLLFWAAVNSSVRDFRTNATVISFVGVALVLATTAAVAWTLHALDPAVPWAAAVVLGAIVAPPDVVVTLSMLCGLTLPRTVTTILKGESLINDAASLVVYRMAVTAAVMGQFSWSHGALEFLKVAIGGAAMGFASGALIIRIRRQIGDIPSVQITLSLLTPFIAYLPADAAGVSGVLAVVVAGLYIGRKGPRIATAETRIKARDTWTVVTFILESLTFLLIGLDLPYARNALDGYALSTLVFYCFVISAVIAAVRLLSAFPTAYLSFWLDRHARQLSRKAPTWQNIAFFSWSGLRGGDSLIVALTLPLFALGGAPFPARNLIIVLTFGVVLISILVQGLSMRPLVRLLKLQSDGLAEAEERDAEYQVAVAGLAALEQVDAGPAPPARTSTTCKVLRHLREMHALAPVSSLLQEHSLALPGNLAWLQSYRELRTRMVMAERSEIVRLRDKDIISDEVMHRLLQVTDLEEILLSTKMQSAMRQVGRGET